MQGFSKITTLLTSILKTTRSTNKSFSRRNNSSKQAFKENNSDGKINRFDGSDVKHVKKSGKLKGQKLSKF